MKKEFNVFYDGSCPLCNKEISLYKNTKCSQPINYVDVSSSEFKSENKEQLMQRFHIQTKDGEILSGAKAFVALWYQMPGWKILAKICDNRIILPIAEYSYTKFLKFRPKIKQIVSNYETSIPKDLVRDLRSDYAGETGAVYIYKGILFVTKDSKLIEVSQHHLITEQKHLDMVAKYLPKYRRTILKPFWIAAGFLTGYLPTLFSSNATYKTIHAVETFVDKHYQDQIDKIMKLNDPSLSSLLEDLKQAQKDECNHRDEAGELF